MGSELLIMDSQRVHAMSDKPLDPSAVVTFKRHNFPMNRIKIVTDMLWRSEPFQLRSIRIAMPKAALLSPHE